jgi:hypothetical protein
VKGWSSAATQIDIFSRKPSLVNTSCKRERLILIM